MHHWFCCFLPLFINKETLPTKYLLFSQCKRHKGVSKKNPKKTTTNNNPENKRVPQTAGPALASCKALDPSRLIPDGMKGTSGGII